MLGDPRWLPHPVVQIGRLITTQEQFLRRHLKNETTGGILLLAGTAGTAAVTTWALLKAASGIGQAAGFIAATAVCYTCLAARSLHLESALVADAIMAGDII